MGRGDPPTRSISRSQNVLVLPAARRSGRLLDLWPRRPKHSARFRRTLKFFRQTNAGVTIRSIHQLLLHKEDASSAIKTLMNNSGGQRSAVRCFSSLAIARAAFGVAWKCSAGSQHLPRIPYESGDRRSFPCEWANCSDGRARRRKDRLHGTCRRNLRAERLYIDTLSYYFSFSVASNKPPLEKKATLIVLFGDQARDPHKDETRLGLGDWEA
jgi:hypothetical protein